MTKLKKFEPVVWNTAHQSAFEQLKRVLTEAPVLMQPRVDQPFIIETDASDAAIGGCLLQYDTDGKLHPVAYSSMKLSPAQFKYPVHEKELLAIKEALRVWACYVDNGHEVTILTDHESLKYMNTIKRLSKRLVRWIDEFQAWKLNIKYRRGSEAIVPDALSRRPDLLNAMALGLAPEKDEYVVFMEAYLRDKTLPGNEFDELIKSEAPHFVIVDDRLMRRVGAEGDEAPYLEWQFRGDFIQRMHNEYGHMSREGMNDLTLRRAWWPKMDKDIQEFVKSCPNCQVGQRQRRMQEREEAQLPTSRFVQPFERWGIDLIGRLPKTRSGNRWIITAIDYATSWPVAKAVAVATEDVIADFIFDEIYMHYGAPQEIFTDGGKNLWGGVVQKYLEKIRTSHKGTSPYHPRTNGKVESLNGLLGRMLSRFLWGKPTKLWDLYLDQALFACRVRTHATTKLSSFYLVYGKHPRLLGDDNYPMKTDAPNAEYESRIAKVQSARQEATRLAHERALRAKDVHDERVVPHHLDAGQWVLVRHENPKKFEPKWFGPYQILERKLLGTYRLQDPNGKELAALVHGNRLLKTNLSSVEELRELWASPARKDQLRRHNINAEWIPSDDPVNTAMLEKYLFEDAGDEDPTTNIPVIPPGAVESTAPPSLSTATAVTARQESDSPLKVKIILRRLREQEAVESLTTTKRQKH